MKSNLVEEFAIVDLEQRLEFSCCGGGGTGGGTGTGGGGGGVSCPVGPTEPGTGCQQN
jgi:hypothetical protein